MNYDDVEMMVESVPINERSMSENVLKLAYFLESGLHLSAFVLNLLLLQGLRSFSGFHSHMSIICRHICAVIMLSSGFGLLRSIMAVYDWSSTNNLQLQTVTDDDCLFNSAQPHFLSILFCVLPLILVIERAYATQNCRSYEYDSWEAGLRTICAILWIPLPLVLLSNMSRFLSYENNFVSCEVRSMKQNVLQRNIWLVVVVFFNLVFAMVFTSLIKSNKEYEKDYLTNNYSTISIRFQMRENLSTCSFLAKMQAIVALFYFLPLCVDVYSFDADDSLLAKLVKREVWYMFQPVLYVFYPIFFARSHKRLFEKLMKILDRQRGKEPCLAV